MNRWWKFWIVGLGLLGIGLGACAPARPEVSPLEGFSPLPAPPLPIPTQTPARSGGPAVEFSLKEMIEQARQDLAARLGVPAAEIQVVEARAVTWPDSSLGCPEPGRMYLQVLTPGYRIVLEVRGQRYAYHAGRQGPPFLCPSGRAREPVGED
ncbi:hypothetical protein HRbin22_00464 [Candidatus Thermoflexus japonica]|uniref:Lipoprotein n=1 Tax=Candidatus Thermoflexus japonica TaxID=2035417 RepID=A0A2H5Y456_9CHLR|nr:hypothetical protein HRbin22_00464 [Candidatus Thermoflexus japonica]